MKTKEEVLKDLFATLAEIQSNTTTGDLEKYLKIKLEVLYEIIGDDVPEEFWGQIEKAIIAFS